MLADKPRWANLETAAPLTAKALEENMRGDGVGMREFRRMIRRKYFKLYMREGLEHLLATDEEMSRD